MIVLFLNAQVLSTDGDAELGGDDFTRTLAGLALHKAMQGGGLSSSDSTASTCSSSSSLSGSEISGDSGVSVQGSSNASVGSSSSKSATGVASKGGSTVESGTEKDVFSASRSLLSTLTPAQRLSVLTAAEAAKQQLGTGDSQQSVVVELPESIGTRQQQSQEVCLFSHCLHLCIR